MIGTVEVFIASIMDTFFLVLFFSLFLFQRIVRAFLTHKDHLPKLLFTNAINSIQKRNAEIMAMTKEFVMP